MDLEESRKLFREEAKERLAEIEEAMLALEERPDDTELVSRTFRAMHTIKGSGAMFEFHDIVDFTHDIETIYDLVRDNAIPVSKELITLTLRAHDEIHRLLDESDGDEESLKRRTQVSNAFKKLLPTEKKEKKIDSTLRDPDPHRLEENTLKTFRIRFTPAQDIYLSGTKPILLLNELRDLGDCEIFAQVDQIPELPELNPEYCHIYWDILLRTDKGRNAIDDVFIFVDDDCDVTISEITTVIDDLISPREKKLGEILVDRGEINQNDLEHVLKKQIPVGEILVSEGVVDAGQVNVALAEQQFVKKVKEPEKKVDVVSSIRVPSDKLDKLVDLVGELVTGQARLSQIAKLTDRADLMSVTEDIERLTVELRDNTMSVRMLTLNATFSRFKRLVHDLGNDLNKEVNLTTKGAETELDKTVIEQLNDPLIHIIRNSVDHGIEPPEVRAASGKPVIGTIALEARYSGAHVVIEIRDDGAGLNADIIRKKAIEQGLFSPEVKLTDKEVFQFVFHAGFSTAAKVTNVSGRGVGMDVVKRGLEALRGTVEIDSKLGKGTTLTLKLPLTLAIIDGLLVKVGPDYFIFPLASIEECIELTKRDIKNTHGRHVVNVRDQIIPYIRLRDQFLIEGGEPAIEQIVITEIGEQRVGFVVDKVIGQHQTVIKNLSRLYKHVEGISGATIMADGTVSLIVDLNNLVKLVELEERQNTNTPQG